MQTTRLSTILLVSFFFAATSSAQVFETGPDDPSLFTNVFNLPGDVLPGSIGGVDGETTQLNIAGGGSVGNGFDINSGVELNVSGGTVGRCSQANSGSEVNVISGSVGDEFFIIGQANISGGSVGDNANALGEVNVSGGSVGDNFLVSGTVNLSGGSVGNEFTVSTSGTVNLFGSAFTLDDVLMDDLVVGEAFLIEDRDVTLSGVLEDGSPFSFDLNIDDIDSGDRFPAGATLTVTLTSGSVPVLLGDVNQDNFVNFADISAFIAILSSTSFQAEADTNEDGDVNFADIGPFISLLAL